MALVVVIESNIPMGGYFAIGFGNDYDYDYDYDYDRDEKYQAGQIPGLNRASPLYKSRHSTIDRS